MEKKTVFNDLDTLNSHFASETSKRAQERKISYSEALLQVARENPALMELRQAFCTARASTDQSLGHFVTDKATLLSIERQIETVVKAAQIERPELSSGQAIRIAATEHADLFREAARIRRRIDVRFI
jgi:uncharacterized protein YoaH (UPF0181 family)